MTAYSVTVWFLFFGSLDGGLQPVPTYYTTREACEQAWAAVENAPSPNGPRYLTHVCVPSEIK